MSELGNARVRGRGRTKQNNKMEEKVGKTWHQNGSNKTQESETVIKKKKKKIQNKIR